MLMVMQRTYPTCDIIQMLVTGKNRKERQEANELICELVGAVYETVDAILASGSPVFSQRDECWFAEGVEVSNLLRRQGMDSSTGDEISIDEISALFAAERSRIPHTPR